MKKTYGSKILNEIAGRLNGFDLSSLQELPIHGEEGEEVTFTVYLRRAIKDLYERKESLDDAILILEDMKSNG